MVDLQSKTAFIIEDDKDICILLSIFLKSQNIEVINVPSLAKAKLLNEELRPAFIFIDQRLPDGYGFDYISELKNKYPDASIIAMSAQHSTETRTLILQDGIVHYLEKPFKIQELKDLITNIKC
jgi:DNA-binding response OmpR family regulator